MRAVKKKYYKKFLCNFLSAILVLSSAPFTHANPKDKLASAIIKTHTSNSNEKFKPVTSGFVPVPKNQQNSGSNSNKNSPDFYTYEVFETTRENLAELIQQEKLKGEVAEHLQDVHLIAKSKSIASDSYLDDVTKDLMNPNTKIHKELISNELLDAIERLDRESK